MVGAGVNAARIQHKRSSLARPQRVFTVLLHSALIVLDGYACRAARIYTV
jgi:hypothetical protein